MNAKLEKNTNKFILQINETNEMFLSKVMD